MSSKPIILVTGANAGLGFEIVKSLCQSQKPYIILLSGRSKSKADAAAMNAQEEFPKSPSTVKTLQIDIESDESISQAFDKIESEFGCVDVLINNAGAQFDQQFYQGKMTMREMWNKSWDVNTTSTQVITDTFVPLLLKSSDPRLIFITSGTSTLTESEKGLLPVDRCPEKGWPKRSFAISAYRSSKTGMNMMVREWSRLLGEDGVKVWGMSPGFLATGLGGNLEMLKKMGAQDPIVGGNFVKDVVEGLRDADVGKIIRCNDVQPW